MRIHKMSEEKKEEITRAYKTEKEGKNKVRYQAIKLLTDGYKRGEVSRITGIKRDTIREWVTIYNKFGIAGLQDKRKTGNKRKLTNDQKAILKTIIHEKTPEQCGFKGNFWTLPLLKSLIKKECDVAFKSPQSYRNFFSYAGFSFHKPKAVNRKRNPHMRKRFEDDIKKNSKSTEEKIAWYW